MLVPRFFWVSSSHSPSRNPVIRAGRKGHSAPLFHSRQIPFSLSKRVSTQRVSTSLPVMQYAVDLFQQIIYFERFSHNIRQSPASWVNCRDSYVS